MKCYACNHDGDDVISHKVGDELLCLCFGCWDKVAPGGREPLQVLEAILIFKSDPDVGGPSALGNCIQFLEEINDQN